MTTTDDVIRLAHESGFQKGRFAEVILKLKDGSWINCIDQVTRLIALAKAEEREACVAAIEQLEHGNVTTCAAAIRARSKEQA